MPRSSTIPRRAAAIWRSATMAILSSTKTPITPILMSVGLDRRAAEDDPLPEVRSQFLVQAGIDVRRGAAADALDPAGQRIGSRLWLLDRAKQTETTRLLFLSWLSEAMAWAERETGQPAELDAEWIAPQ